MEDQDEDADRKTHMRKDMRSWPGTGQRDIPEGRQFYGQYVLRTPNYQTMRSLIPMVEATLCEVLGHGQTF